MFDAVQPGSATDAAPMPTDAVEAADQTTTNAIEPTDAAPTPLRGEEGKQRIS